MHRHMWDLGESKAAMSNPVKANPGMVGETRNPQHTDQHLSGLCREKEREVFGYDSKDHAGARCRASPPHGVTHGAGAGHSEEQRGSGAGPM